MNLRMLVVLSVLCSALCLRASAQDTVKTEATTIMVSVEGPGIKKPGSYKLKTGATITQAIEAAGGPDYTGESGGAMLNKVRLLREKRVTVIDVKKILAHQAENLSLQDQDKIQVPEAIF